MEKTQMVFIGVSWTVGSKHKLGHTREVSGLRREESYLVRRYSGLDERLEWLLN